MCNLAFIQDWLPFHEDSMPHSESDMSHSSDEVTPEKPMCDNNVKNVVGNVALTTTDSSSYTEIPWYFDSGCSRNMTENLDCLDKVEEIRGGKVTFGLVIEVKEK